MRFSNESASAFAVHLVCVLVGLERDTMIPPKPITIGLVEVRMLFNECIETSKSLLRIKSIRVKSDLMEVLKGSRYTF